MTDSGLLLVSVVCRYYAERGAGEGYVAAVGRGAYCSGPGSCAGHGDGVCAAGYRLTVSFCVVAPAGVRTRTM